MRKSTNFNLNLVEGNDLVNPLVQDVPNYEAIDEQMYKNECNSIGIATELKSGTIHALTRTIPNAPMFRFKATSNFTAGDTFTVDGIQVSALTPNGETLASNSYIIGSEVLCVLREMLLTVYVSGGVVITAQDSEKLGGQLPAYYGTAENVSTALETAQSANQLTLNLQQSLENVINNSIQKLLFSDVGWIAPAIFSNRVVILDGGYIAKEGFCYVNMRFKANTNMGANSTWTLFTGLPIPQKICPLVIAPYSEVSEDLWQAASCAITSDGALRYKSSETFSSGCCSVIGFYKIKN